MENSLRWSSTVNYLSVTGTQTGKCIEPMNTADALVLEITLWGCIEKLRSAEFQNGPECMTLGNIPDCNSSISDLSCWLEELVSSAMKQQLTLSKHVKHRFASHTEKAIKKDTAAIANKLKLQNTITPVNISTCLPT